MDAVLKPVEKTFERKSPDQLHRPSREEAEAAVRTLLAWTGDDPDREGLVETPKRVVKALSQLYSGYFEDPAEHLARTFEDVGGYKDIVLVRGIPFHSHCDSNLDLRDPCAGVLNSRRTPFRLRSVHFLEPLLG